MGSRQPLTQEGSFQSPRPSVRGGRPGSRRGQCQRPPAVAVGRGPEPKGEAWVPAGDLHGAWGLPSGEGGGEHSTHIPTCSHTGVHTHVHTHTQIRTPLLIRLHAFTPTPHAHPPTPLRPHRHTHVPAPRFARMHLHTHTPSRHTHTPGTHAGGLGVGTRPGAPSSSRPRTAPQGQLSSPPAPPPRQASLSQTQGRKEVLQSAHCPVTHEEAQVWSAPAAEPPPARWAHSMAGGGGWARTGNVGAMDPRSAPL